MSNEQAMLLRKISSVRFALAELKLFLDTHPDNKDALTMFGAYDEKNRKLTDEYEKRYGLITADGGFDNTEWEWIKGPWPWERDREMND